MTGSTSLYLSPRGSNGVALPAAPRFWTSTLLFNKCVANNTHRLVSMDSTTIYEKVQQRYSAAAKSEEREYGRKVATAFG